MAGIELLSNQTIKNAKPKDKEYTLSDGGNLYIRIRPNGSKNWLFIYTHPITKKRVKLGLGAYPNLTLAQSRKIADEYRANLANGIDPRLSRDQVSIERTQKYYRTFKSVAEEMLATQEVNESTKRQKLIEEERKIAHIKGTVFDQQDIERITNKVRTSYRKRLFFKRNLYPLLADVSITDITALQVIEAIRPMQKKGNLENVKRACTLANQVMKFAINCGFIHNNCLADIREVFAKAIPSNMPSVAPTELSLVMKVMSNTQMKIVTRCAFEMQLHTITRADELAAMRWCDIDLEKRLWTIPAFFTKSKREHLVPLTDYTVSILEFIRPISGHNKFVFPSDKPNTKYPHISPSAVNSALGNTTLKARLVSHGFRGIASTLFNEKGFNSDAIEMCLAHLDKNQTRAAYNSAKYLDQRIKILKFWSQYIVDATGHHYSIASQYKQA
ncbi:Prophage CP4-57 integrase [Vibrio scophthalmi]|uniref:integrase arm-type DNA-binding domain-containing protein n=1 Tax=Vibrio scophthalmi TaxID=45658 RepID=UPI0008099474|nr:integrase arm-type DNA-binding domain-containing protein [Vibrio scophthalmi]ANS87721.1 Prophage CP4-57 integrase [Vibrio scophthalmi]